METIKIDPADEMIKLIAQAADELSWEVEDGGISREDADKILGWIKSNYEGRALQYAGTAAQLPIPSGEGYIQADPLKLINWGAKAVGLEYRI